MGIIKDLRLLESESIDRGIPIIGSEKAEWLLSKVKELKPQRVLELGTANGYSGIILGCLGAKLLTVEFDNKIVCEAEQNFKTFNIDAQIVVGEGVEVVQSLVDNCEVFDLIFIDFAKKKYIEVFDNCLDLLRTGGFLIADNISFDGCKDFKKRVLNCGGLTTEIVDIKDGLSFSKKSDVTPI
tara:strand:- start:17 stop:565 length:549 start_codon:yes stop_codon:yes gene_type:complete